MRAIPVQTLQRILSGIVAAAPLALAAATACGGATVGDGTAASSGDSTGSSGSSGTDRGSSGTSGTSGGGASSGNCTGQPPRTFTVSYEAPRCDGGVGSGDAGADSGDADSVDAAVSIEDCEDKSTWCQRVCGERTTSEWENIQSCSAYENSDGTRGISCTTEGRPCGRRHEGLAPMATIAAGAIGRYLAESAYVEDASVASFEILARELRLHGAPDRLVRAARKSARDEQGHTRVMTALARRHGATAPRATKPSRPLRSLEAMVTENAIEGCVGETYGALLATYQGAHAEEPRLRAAMRRIAEDETRHAALAWEIAAWAETKLDAEARERVGAARRAAFADLAQALSADPPSDVARAVGLPSAAQAKTMLASLASEMPLAA